jgi:GNAT superfamily N-acetyltransferase
MQFLKANLIAKLISADDCKPLRSLVLRWGLPPAQCTFPEDRNETTFHLGVLLQEKIISVGTFINNSLAQFPGHKNPYQLRGMATAPEARGLGAGRLLLETAEVILKEKGCQLLWFNAREKAFLFYEKSGYIELNGQITISEFGPHKIMLKELW